jgi:hypothetical protein
MTVSQYSNRRIYWPSQETVGDFDFDDDTKTAGWFDLNTEGQLVCGLPSRGQTLIWTTTDLWVATYIGGTLLYSFAQVGGNCGIVSPRAAVVLDTGAYWMGYGQFYRYDGFVLPLPCEVADYVFGSIEYSLAIWCLANPMFSEVTWFYPSEGETHPDRYVTFNYVENHWSFGELARTCGVPRQALATVPVPIMMAEDATLYDHETGDDRDGATVYLESGPMEVGTGEQVQRIQRIVPDDLTMGDVDLYLYTALFPDASETLNGPYTAAALTSVRVTARQVRIRLVEAVASAWRVGVIRLGAIAGGRR